MGYPFWVTTNNLGSFPFSYSLTLAPISLAFGETDQLSCTIQLLNGQLPPGVQYTQIAYEIQLTGELLGTGDTHTYEFTFRINNGTYVSDRTFQIQVVQQQSVFEWLTPNVNPLLYVYDNQPQTTQIQATCVPTQLITYTCANINLITQGVELDATGGTFTIQLAWRPNITYTAMRDYVYNGDRLYECVVTGTSASSQGPQQLGLNVVDTMYSPWQPNRLYVVNSVVHNDLGKIYKCIQTGTSDVLSGPTGTGSYIQDGSAYWAYEGQALVWSQVPTNTQVAVQLQCVAQTQTSINRTFNIQLVSREAAPIWLTDAGTLLSLSPGQLFAYQLLVQDPDQTVLTWQGVDIPSWITLSVTGLLFGQAPQVQTTTTYAFQILVSDSIHTQSRSFEILITQAELTLAWVSESQLGTIQDGVISNLFVQAQSPQVGATITYGWVGGQLPLGLQLNNQTGHLQGFVEFHAQPKHYYFEIQAADGVHTIVQEFEVHVQATHRNAYWNVHVPMWGDTRNQLITINNNSVVADSVLYLPNDVGWGRNQSPSIYIAGGIKACAVDQMRLLITNYMHAWNVMLQDLQITQVPDTEYKTLDVQVHDAVAPPLWQPNTTYAQNARVSGGDGSQYVATNAGTSGSMMTTWGVPQTTDNNIVWQLLNSPNTSSPVSTPLPWYAVHVYTVGMTTMRNGVTYVCIQAGQSGGTWPTVTASQTIVTDNQIIWQKVSQVPAASNTYWPSCVQNMRRVLTSSLGYSRTLGSQADLQLQVIAGSGAVGQVTVRSPGTGYWIAPPAHIESITGSGAQLQVSVGILQAQVITSTTGVINLQIFELDLNTGEPAQLQVTAVNQFNQATQVQVLYGGSYTQIPSVPLTVQVGTGKITLRLQVGIMQVQVIAPGTGYSSEDLVSLAGTEWDPVRQQFVDEFNLNMCVAFCATDASIDVPVAQNPYAGTVIPIDKVQVDLQGIQWQGHTRWDSDTCTWDASQTQFVEQSSATETTWDQTELSWDNQITTFDTQPLIINPAISLTQFDQDRTLFDYYATVFDAQPVQYASRTKKSWVWFMSTHS